MKKRRKLVLNRQTLRILDTAVTRRVRGAGTDLAGDPNCGYTQHYACVPRTWLVCESGSPTCVYYGGRCPWV